MSVGGQAEILNAQDWSKLEKVGQSVKHQTIWALLRFTGCRSQRPLDPSQPQYKLEDSVSSDVQ